MKKIILKISDYLLFNKLYFLGYIFDIIFVPFRFKKMEFRNMLYHYKLLK